MKFCLIYNKKSSSRNQSTNIPIQIDGDYLESFARLDMKLPVKILT